MITGPRQSGKTSELIKRAKITGGKFIVVVPNQIMKYNVIGKFKIPHKRVIVFKSFLRKYVAGELLPDTDYYLDDVDVMFEQLQVKNFAISPQTKVVNK